MHRLRPTPAQRKDLKQRTPYSLPVPMNMRPFSETQHQRPPLSRADVNDVFALEHRILGSELATHLTAWFGEADLQVPGKYRKADAFFFDVGEGEVVVATCEPGARGSSWHWLPADATAAAEAYGPGNVIMGTAPPFWLGVLLDLAARFQADGHPIDSARVRAFLVDIQPELFPGDTPEAGRKTGPKA